MNADASEDIYTRIKALLSTVSGMASVWRNRGDIDNLGPFPAGVLLDGGGRLTQDVTTRKFVKMPPALFELTPQVWFIAQKRDTIANLTLDQEPAPIGPELSSWRSKISNAIVNDPELIDLIGGPRGPGQIVYRGWETDMRLGEPMEGQFLMNFGLIYTLFPLQG